MNKKILLKILIVLSLVGITIVSFTLINNYAKNNANPNVEDTNKEDNSLINVSMQLIDKNGNVIFDEVRKAEDKEVLYDVLVRFHEVRAESSTYGMIIFDIDSVKTKFYSDSYISILVNDKYSSFGISSIYVYDGIKITFKEVAL